MALAGAVLEVRAALVLDGATCHGVRRWRQPRELGTGVLQRLALEEAAALAVTRAPGCGSGGALDVAQELAAVVVLRGPSSCTRSPASAPAPHTSDS